MTGAFESTLAARRDLPRTRAEDPDRIDRFIVLGRLGAGGMGVVLEAYDPDLDRRVAIKVLKHSDSDSEARARLLREAQSMARLSHPNVVAVHEVGEHDGRVFIAMELVVGRTLGQWREAEDRSAAEIVSTFMQAGEGLAAAHAASVVHRDFKPDNVLVDDSGRTRVTDFGLAKPRAALLPAPVVATAPRGRTSVLEDVVTQQGAVMGTPAYMSPEQIMGREAGPASDQFSYCVTLWEALTGERPFVADNLVELAIKLESEDPPRPALRLDPVIERALRRGLSRDPAQRWPSMEALLLQLRRARRRRMWRRGGYAAVSVALLSLVAWSGVAAREAAMRERCVEEGHAIEGTWNAEREDVLVLALSSSGSSFAADTSQRVARALSAYAADWASATSDLCVATSVDHVLAAEDAGPRSACLTDLAGEFDATIVLLTEPAEGTSLHAFKAVHGLTPVADCDNDLLLQRYEDQSTPAADAARVRRQLANSMRLGLVARYGEARDLAEAALGDARELGSDRLLGEAHLVAGSLSTATGAYEDAIEHLDAATDAALAAQDDRTTVSALTKVAFVIGHELERADGVQTARLALGLAHRLGHDCDAVDANALDTLGSVLFRHEEYEEASQRFRAALECWERSSGAESEGAAISTMNLANALQLTDRASDAIDLYQRAIQLEENLFGPMHPLTAQAINNYGAALFRAGRHNAALEQFQRALATREEVLGPEHPKVAESLKNSASVLSALGRHAPAISRMRRALEINEARFGIGGAATMRSVVDLAALLRESGKEHEARATLETYLGRLPSDAATARGTLLSALGVEDEQSDAP